MSKIPDPNHPICWFGNDRLVLDDITRHGLHRMVIARKESEPDFKTYFEMASKKAEGAEIMHFESRRNGFYLHWFVWKENKG